MLSRFSIVLALLFAAISAGAAQTLYGQTGRCQSLTLADRGVSGQCEDTIYTARVALDQVAFVFVTQEGTHVAFSWAQSADEDLTGKTPGEHALRRVGFVFRNEIEWLKTDGTCVVGKAYNTDTTIACEAKTDKGRFAGQFQTEARDPPKKFFGFPAVPGTGLAK